MQTTLPPFPPIAISVSDHIKLRRLAAQAEADAHPVAAFLHAELARAAVTAEADLPAHTVRPGQWVTHRIDWGWPAESRLKKDRRTLAVTFDDGASFALPAEMLRVLSPSAEVQGHSPEERRTVPGKRHVRIVGAEPVGNYAVRLVFDDGHNTGLFTWDYLLRLGRAPGTQRRRSDPVHRQ